MSVAGMGHVRALSCSRRRHRIKNLRRADLSRATSPRAFGGVLLARFDVRVDPLEQRELIALLQDEVRGI